MFCRAAGLSGQARSDSPSLYLEEEIGMEYPYRELCEVQFGQGGRTYDALLELRSAKENRLSLIWRETDSPKISSNGVVRGKLLSQQPFTLEGDLTQSPMWSFFTPCKLRAFRKALILGVFGRQY